MPFTDTLAPRLLGDIRWPAAAFVGAAPDPDLAKRAKRNLGFVPGGGLYLPPVMWLAETLHVLIASRSSRLPRGLCAMVDLIVSQDNSCRYCYGSTRMQMKMQGYSERRLRRIEHDFHAAPITDAERTALEFARKVSRGSPRPVPADFQALQAAGFGRQDVVDLTAAAVKSVFMNRLATLLSMQPEPIHNAVNGPWGALLGPLIGAMMRGKKQAWDLPPLPADAETPFDGFFDALASCYLHEQFRWATYGAMHSPGLPARARGLMIAVIAAALDCRVCRGASRAILAPEGFDGRDCDAVVTHLASPKLSPFEARLVRFARETVRYRTEAIHEKCVELYRDLDRTTIIEIAGVASLANAMGRLSVLADG